MVCTEVVPEQLKTTRMHSSRMRTVRSSGRRGCGGVCPGGGCGPGECVCPGGGCVCWGVSAQGNVCPSACWDTHPHPPMNRMTDRRLWKYYLAATTLRTVKILPKSLFENYLYNQWQIPDSHTPTKYKRQDMGIVQGGSYMRMSNVSAITRAVTKSGWCDL